ncbi:salicylic acid-binding protein 2-like [Diospyros lotus]|uniref:salicylic acid-binding protein 2-like n=1 Tax=Diospyros lotus TaxID=55363 RepID=UPI00224EC620|nr:salicylic acid-binding protein 2-like [Diospyros lotus]
MEAAAKQQKHFVLVHGACHGAWCWYKLKPLLESGGHRVTAVDLLASGVNTAAKSIQEVRSLYEYSLPLLETLKLLPEGEKVILVGHSLGGLSLALAMDKFPDKIAVAVFLTAFMPDSLHKPSYVLEQFWKRTSPEIWLDTKFESYGTPEKPLTSMFFGPKCLASSLYQLCSIEDLTLAKMLVRPGSLFLEDLASSNNLSTEGFGSVRRVFVVCDEDKAITPEFQLWMIDNTGSSVEVKEIKGADHMPMLCKPRELCDCLLEIATEHS